MLGMRMEPRFQAIRREIAAGTIGEPILATAQKSYKFGESRPDFYRDEGMYGGSIITTYRNVRTTPFILLMDIPLILEAYGILVLSTVIIGAFISLKINRVSIVEILKDE